MSDIEFDTALVNAAFRLAGEDGWRSVTVAKAARAADLSLAEARARFPSRNAILLRFGRLADQVALRDVTDDGNVRDRLFDLLMRRFDVLQTHRAGVKALLQGLPTDPGTALLLACATTRSMRWMLHGAGVSTAGARGELQVSGLLAVWLWALRAWERDDSEDLSGTMAAIDKALDRADRLAAWVNGRRAVPDQSSVAEAPTPTGGAGELDPANPPIVDAPVAPDPPATGLPDPVVPPPVSTSPTTTPSPTTMTPPITPPAPVTPPAPGELDPSNRPSDITPPQSSSSPKTPPSSGPPSGASPSNVT